MQIDRCSNSFKWQPTCRFALSKWLHIMTICKSLATSQALTWNLQKRTDSLNVLNCQRFAGNLWRKVQRLSLQIDLLVRPLWQRTSKSFWPKKILTERFLPNGKLSYCESSKISFQQKFCYRTLLDFKTWTKQKSQFPSSWTRFSNGSKWLYEWFCSLSELCHSPGSNRMISKLLNGKFKIQA